MVNRYHLTLLNHAVAHQHHFIMQTFKFKSRFSFLALGAACFLGLLTLNSCEKDSFTPSENIEAGGEVNFRETGDGVIDYSQIEALIGQINLGAISVDGELGALRFASDEDLVQTMSLLEQAEAALDNEIASSISGLSEDVVDEMEINDNFAFEAFENNFPGFTSHRAMVAQLEEAFFANQDLNDEEDPTDAYDAIPDVLGVILNTNGEVISNNGSEFENQIHVARLDGGNYTILDGNLETALQIRSGLDHAELAEMPNVQVVDEPNASGGSPESMGRCDSRETKRITRYASNGSRLYRAKMKVRVQNFSFLWWSTHRGYSELKSRRKRWWGWRKDFTTISINQQGNLYPSTYYTYTCIKYKYDDKIGQWVPYVTTCIGENPCDGEAINAASSGTSYTWKYRRSKSHNSKVSASDKDGSSGILRATFQWRGQTHNLSIF